MVNIKNYLTRGFCWLLAGGNWWNPKVGFSIPHSQCPCMDSQPDFGKNLPARCHLLSKLTFSIRTFTACLFFAFIFALPGPFPSISCGNVQMLRSFSLNCILCSLPLKKFSSHPLSLSLPHILEQYAFCTSKIDYIIAKRVIYIKGNMPQILDNNLLSSL